MISVFAIARSQSVRILKSIAFTVLLLGGSHSVLAQDSIDAEVSITRGESVQISNIDDWLIGVFTSIDTINNIQYNWDWECVYSSTGSYRVEVVSQNGGSELRLNSGTDSMRYWIYAYFRQGNTYRMRGFTDPNFTLNNLSGSTQLDCSDEPVAGTNLWFAALVRPADFNPAPPGIYQDLVTLLVSPE